MNRQELIDKYKDKLTIMKDSRAELCDKMDDAQNNAVDYEIQMVANFICELKELEPIQNKVSSPLVEGKTKSNVKSSSQTGRKAPPPPPVRVIKEGEEPPKPNSKK